MDKRVRFAKVPVTLEFPDQLSGTVASVLEGEYECGYFGEKLSIVDIGANVGSFTIWANLRWPQSTIHSYEPNPGTFQMLSRNVAHLPNVVCHEQAVYTGTEATLPLYSRYAGDGEAGLVAYMSETFQELPRERTVAVSVIHPRDLPRCDVMKLDVEGAEARILENATLDGVSLIVLEYQNRENRRAIEERLHADFDRVHHDSFPWARILAGSQYRPDLRGDEYGHLMFARKQHNRLRRDASEPPGDPTLRQLLRGLPGAAKRAIARRAHALLKGR
jgi:FkbM family methyltransferase